MNKKDWMWIFWYDWALLPIYAIVIYLLFRWWGKNHCEKDLYPHFKRGLLLKFLGGVAFAFYHQYIFRGGDTILYFKTGLDIRNLIGTDFNRYLSLVLLPTKATEYLHVYTIDYVVYAEPNFFVARVVAIVTLLSLSSYLPTLLCFTALSYIGIWHCYSTVCKVYPNLKKELAISFLYIPSVLFWGSGLGKDSLSFGATCLVFGALIRLLLLPKPKIISNLIYLFVGASVVIIVKSYIFYSFILSFSFGILMHRLIMIKNMGIKIIVFPLLTGLSIGLFIIILNFTSATKNIGLDTAAETVIQNNKYLSIEKEAGSSYDLGIKVENVNGIGSILPVFPKSIFITLFRPFLWEVNGIAMLMSAIESSCFLAIFIYILFKKRIFGIFPVLFSNPIAISCLIFTLVFAGFIGISSGNFGTLVRYKIPCIPFFCMLLAILYKDVKPKKIAYKPPHIT